jgi:hypothetical protein
VSLTAKRSIGVEIIVDASFKKEYIGLLNQLISQCDQKISEFDEMLKLDDLDPKFEVYINEKRNESLLNKEQLRLQIKSIKGTKDGDPFLLTTLDGYQPLVEGQNIFDIISPALLTIKDGVIDSIHS